jgi:hypothetical protein
MINRILSSAIAATMTLSLGWPVAAQAETKAQKEPTAAQMAARARMTKCSAEWKETKAAGKVEPGMKWPRFWSACNTRMRGNKA